MWALLKEDRGPLLTEGGPSVDLDIITKATFVKVAAVNSNGSSITAITATVLGDVAVGNTLIIGVTSSGDGTLVSATDTKGNTYTIDRNSNATTGGQIVSCVVTTALVAGDVITVNGSTAQNARSIIAAEFSGVGSFDQVMTTVQTAIPFTSGNTPATTQDLELVVGFVGVSATAGTIAINSIDPSFTYIVASGLASVRQLYMYYKFVAAKGPQAISGNLSASSGVRATVATYKLL